MSKIKIGIIKEGKVPVDHRVPFTPDAAKEIELMVKEQVARKPAILVCPCMPAVSHQGRRFLIEHPQDAFN